MVQEKFPQSALQNLRVQKWVALLSVVLLGVKFFAYYLTNSVAILTDALESIVNVSAGFIGLYSLYVSAKPADKDHPYGHGKAEFISAAIEGTLILTAGSLTIYKAIKTLLYPEPLSSIDTGIWLVAITAVANYFIGITCVRIGNRNQSMALVASGRHLQTDTLSTIGIIAGLVLLFFTKWVWVDSAVALLFGGIIIFTGYKIVSKSIAGIMDKADLTLLERMVALLNKSRHINWVDLHNLRVIKYGAILHLDCHLTLPWYLNGMRHIPKLISWQRWFDLNLENHWNYLCIVMVVFHSPVRFVKKKIVLSAYIPLLKKWSGRSIIFCLTKNIN
jgi:cation diffusion facilitator family transporter